MVDELGPRELPPGIERFVAGQQLDAAASAIEYAWQLLQRSSSPPERATIQEWCYDFAAAGAPYWDWPDLAMARHRDGAAGGELEKARRDAMSQALIDYGENGSVRSGQGRDSQWS
jgi:hypothetical protein